MSSHINIKAKLDSLSLEKVAPGDDASYFPSQNRERNKCLPITELREESNSQLNLVDLNPLHPFKCVKRRNLRFNNPD